MQCSHCHLEFDEKRLLKVHINGHDEYFCCKGCEGVYKLLYAEGLEDFYNKIGANTLEPAKILDENLDSFDSTPFFERYVRQKDNYCELALVLERIHCIACVWLNEKILAKTTGILKVNINYTNNKATLLYDPKSIKISEIIQVIRSIGYDAHAYDPRLQETYAQKEKREYYIKMVVGIFCVMNIMWIAVAQYAGYFSGITSQMRNILNFAGFTLATPVLFFSGIVFWRGALSAFKYKTPNMDLLVISGASLAYLYSIYASFKGEETYFESVAMIITFVLIGKFLEVRGKKSAVDSLDKLNAQMPLSVRVAKSESEEFKEVSVESVCVGDVVQVFAGERVALDGVLLSENALCDESAINGEALPRQKSAKDSIYSGSLALDMPFLYRVSKTYKESLMMQIVSLVEDSLNARPKIQEMANFITRYFSSVILSLAFGTFLYWEYVLNVSFDKALMVMISVIIIACPCALALATPIASLVGLGEALKHRILFKEARFLETIAKANILVLDKTGTLTEGRLKVQNVREFERLDYGVLVAMLEQNAHPVSRGVLEFIKESGGCESLIKIKLDKITQKSARGILAEWSGSVYLGGNLELLKEHGVKIPQDLENRDCSVFYFAKDTKIIAQFFLQDSIKQDAKIAISKLQAKGIDCVLLSGDHLGVCERVAGELGITEFYGNQSPLEKADFIDKLHAQGKVVVMAGDGINDSVALSKSDIGIAMGGGIDLAISVSDIVVLDDSMQGVLESFRIGRRTYRFILQNLALSLLYNALTIPLAMTGLVIPLIAALSMSLSSLLVVGNSLRIKGE
ncbi:heavy metal translocating P-type ATPase [Helicobacter turcicus]|uniref:Copper-transporting ATPase n=1 Tax=Helicobacter turcicus TaxID=2867412 RepID=A0ABS7JMS1_9HELI|nr:heavy metal translocating P-type ATPase [Helicobacter turcicus]MBX7490705.1 heavy metal translocating P-type ATPase [Helicobacter turcicus]MBX7545686.1 heavy metal translocating P-type ATPase [Helicobacter turcicus]